MYAPGHLVCRSSRPARSDSVFGRVDGHVRNPKSDDRRCRRSFEISITRPPVSRGMFLRSDFDRLHDRTISARRIPLEHEPLTKYPAVEKGNRGMFQIEPFIDCRRCEVLKVIHFRLDRQCVLPGTTGKLPRDELRRSK